MATRKQSFSLRVRPATLRRLEQQATRRGEPKTNLAERYLDESVRSADHPGIVFRDGPAGRYPALAGHRLAVWEIIETAREEGGDVRATAEYLSLPSGLVRAALGYYADYAAEIDAWIDANATVAEEAEASWLRARELLRG